MFRCGEYLSGRLAENRLNKKAYLSTVYPSSGGCFRQDSGQCQKARIISKVFERDNEFSVLKLPPRSPSQSNIAPLKCVGIGDSQTAD